MKTYMALPKKQVVEADVIDVPYDSSEEIKKKYLEKIRKMGILKQKSEMPKNLSKSQIGMSVKKSGREGFEPVGSKKSFQISEDAANKENMEYELGKQFRGLTPDQINKKEEELLIDLHESYDQNDTDVKKYKEILRKRMRTA